MRTIYIFLYSVLLILACGSDEIPTPTETKPNYFPDAIGSTWVYRSLDGIQWTWSIKEEKTIEDFVYLYIDTSPTLVLYQCDYLLPNFLRSSENQILFNIRDKIDYYIHNKLPEHVKEEFSGLDVKVEINPISFPELLFLEIPITTNKQSEIYNIKIDGNFILQDLLLLNIPFEVHIKINCEVIGERSVDTPVGEFDRAYQLEYQIDTINTVFSDEKSTKLKQTIWFVPYVGIVKIEDERGVLELIEYQVQ